MATPRKIKDVRTPGDYYWIQSSGRRSKGHGVRIGKDGVARWFSFKEPNKKPWGVQDHDRLIEPMLRNRKVLLCPRP